MDFAAPLIRSFMLACADEFWRSCSPCGETGGMHIPRLGLTLEAAILIFNICASLIALEVLDKDPPLRVGRGYLEEVD
jgi:hypothetical protein